MRSSRSRSLSRLQLHHVAFYYGRMSSRRNGERRKEIFVSIRMEFMQFLWLHGKGLCDDDDNDDGWNWVAGAGAHLFCNYNGAMEWYIGWISIIMYSNCLIDSPATHGARTIRPLAARLMVMRPLVDNTMMRLRKIMMIKVGAAPQLPEIVP